MQFAVTLYPSIGQQNSINNRLLKYICSIKKKHKAKNNTGANRLCIVVLFAQVKYSVLLHYYFGSVLYVIFCSLQM